MYQSSFSSDEEMLEVIACVVFSKGCDVVKDFSIWKDDLESDAVCVEGIVPNEVNSTCVCSEVASNLA
jgi:hypothetical protein